MNEMADPLPRSFLMWVVRALGPYAIMLPLCALGSFALTLLLVFRGKGSATWAALLLIVPAPMLLGLFGALNGSVASFSVVAMSDVALKTSEVAAGVSAALLLPFAGMLLAGPSYLAATIGLICRSLQGHDH
jgi:hypothetical protein